MLYDARRLRQVKASRHAAEASKSPMVEGSGTIPVLYTQRLVASWYSPSGLTEQISSAGIRGHIKALIRYGELADVLVFVVL